MTSIPELHPSQPLLDSHMHLFRSGYASVYDSAWASRDEVALYDSLRRAHHIERALVVGFEGEPQFEGNNADVANWAQQHDWITPLEYCDVTNPPITVNGQNQIFAGISIYAETPEQAQALAAWPQSALHNLNSRRAIISLNTTPEVAGVLHDFIARLTDCRVLLSHAGSPGTFREAPPREEVLRRLEPIRRLSTLGHVGIKVSGMYAISEPSYEYPHRSAHPFLHQLRDDFGAGRLYWGSDFSPALEHVSFAQTIAAVSHLNWPHNEVAAVMGSNLKRLLAG